MGVYRLLLRLFSSPMRAEWRADMEQLAADHLREAEERGESRFRLLLLLYWDAFTQGMQDRIQRVRDGGRRRRDEQQGWVEMNGRGGMMDAFVQDLGHGIRQLRRRPGFALATVLVLALGIGGNTAVFGVLERALIRGLPLQDAERLVTVANVLTESSEGVNLPGFQDWEQAEGPFESLGAFHTTSHSLLMGDTPQRIVLGRTVGDYLGTAGIGAALGRFYEPTPPGQAREAVVVLTTDFWRSAYAADASVIGRSVLIDGEPVTVIGVASPEEELLRFGRRVDAWAPMAEPLPWMGRGTFFLTAIGRLQPHLVPETATAPVEAFGNGFIETGVTENGIVIRPLREALVGDVRPLLMALQAAAVLLLLVVAINAGNLLLARSLEREAEFAVRTALGAGRSRVVRQVLAETTMLALLGGTAGFGVAALGRASVLQMIPGLAVFASESVITASAVLYTFGIAFLVGALAGLRPALKAAGRSWTAARAGGQRVAGVGSRGRRIMVAAEVGLALVLVVSAGLMTRTVLGLQDVDLGFDAEDVFTAQINLSGPQYGEWGARHDFWRQLREDVEALPGVTAAGFGTALPLGRGPDGGSFRIEGREWNGDGPRLDKMAVSPGYFAALGIPVVEGRAFDVRDRADSPGVIMISQSAAERYFPGESAIGRRIRVGWWGEEFLEIVGVVDDVRFAGPDQDVSVMSYLPMSQTGAPDALLVARTTLDPLALTGAVRSAVLEQDPGRPIHNIRSMEDYREGALGSRSALLSLLLGLSAIGLVISCLGVFAVTSQAVRARRREIGIRLALGQTSEGVLQSVLLSEGWVIALGLVGGLVTTVAVTRVLEAFLFGVSALDPMTLLMSVGLLGAVALAAVARPAWEASRIDPAGCLSSE